ncbi:SSU ribosomal protein S20P [Desulfonispora thiosulfatigenes DSM 11270]|uniref:Small ribosomal subunit protein bS20 n=1 Tax=Desulfonispora thiosulfatigenes DSM 11270 TaxID=656914 RepID=A0A1W1VCR9_DESTI|nr:30S ribosomal protein S20 [Desulfonispora thiosulfatigenes]SMB90841.1 SSU ribosomal protein S20P [Desulfonispora thiosulfatigenes DSM 11270]
MANIKSAIKRAKKAQVRALKNKMFKSKLKTAIKNFEKAIDAKSIDEAKATLTNAVKVIDKAASKGLLHKNNAANKKSRLTKMFNKIAG